MATTSSNPEKDTGTTGTDYRSAYLRVGVDERGAHHLWDRETDTVHIILPSGGRERKLLDAGDIYDYLDAVGDAHGWKTRRLYETFGDAISKQVSVR